MAKQQPEVNKSQVIRDILEKNPHTPVKEIVATLAQQGIRVSDTYVYMVKGKAKARKRKEKRDRAIAASNSSGVANPVDLILQVRKVAEAAGGMRHLKRLVDILAE
jgi:arginine repressor